MVKKIQIIDLAEIIISNSTILKEKLFIEDLINILKENNDSFNEEQFLDYIHSGLRLRKKGICQTHLDY